jgi:hypothetical protein
LPLQVDIRDEAAVLAAVQQAVLTFGGIDILVNNASAISLTDTEHTPMKRYDLMNQINARGTYLCTQACLPELKKSAAAGRNAHVLTMSPPLSMKTHWFAPHTAYTMAKYGMSMCTLGHAGEFAQVRHRRQQPLAAHGHRHRRAADDPGRGPQGLPQAGDPGRRCVPGAHLGCARREEHRQLPHRRHAAGCARAGRSGSLCGDAREYEVHSGFLRGLRAGCGVKRSARWAGRGRGSPFLRMSPGAG